MLFLIGPVSKFLVKKIAQKTIKKVIGTRPMFARVTAFQGRPELLAGASETLEKSVVPSGRKQKGSKGAYMMVDAESGKVIAITLWESVEDLEGSAEWSAQALAETAEAIGATGEPEIDVYEVLVRPEG